MALAAATPSWAADDDRDQYGRFRVGPLYLSPRVVLARYDGPNSGDESPDEPIPDATTTLRPSLGATLPVGRRFRLIGGTAVFFNLSGSEQGSFFKGYGFSGGSALDLGPLSFFGGVSTGRGEERVSLDVDQLAERETDGMAGGVQLRLGRRISMGASRISRTTTYEKGIFVEGRSLSDTLDRESDRSRYTLTASITRLTSLDLSADVIDDRFAADDLEVRSYRYLAGLSFRPLAFIRGRVRVGHREVPEGQGVPGYGGPTLDVDASMPLFSFGILSGRAERDIIYAARRNAAGGRSINVLKRYRGDVRFGLPLSLVANPYYGTERSESVEEGLESSFRPTRLNRFGTSLLRAFGRSFRVGGTVEAIEQAGSPGGPRVSYFVTAEWTP